MNLTKKLFKHPVTQSLLSGMLALYIWLVTQTNRKRLHVADDAKIYYNGDKNAIFTLWHGRMMMMPVFYPKCERKTHVLISLHRDGILISDIIGRFGVSTIHGSTSKRSKASVMEILRALKKGDYVAITPDGPRGPAQIAASGIAAIAKLSGKPVIPVTFSASRSKHLGSWDRFLLALPFGRIDFFVGSPLFLGKDANETEQEAFRKNVEQKSNELMEQADNKIYGTQTSHHTQ